MERARRRKACGLVLCTLGALGLLIWLKLRVVTGIPRTVYAEPRDVPPPPAQPESPARPGPPNAPDPRQVR